MDTADGIKAAKTKVDETEEEINETPSKKKRDDIFKKIEDNDGQAQSTSDMVEGVEEVHAKNTLQGLPEDLLRLIIPQLGLQDRSNVAATCKRLYEMEAKVGMSNELVNWGRIYMQNNRIEIDELGRSYKRLKLKTIPFSRMNHAMHRLFRTMKKFYDPLQPEGSRNRPYISFSGQFDLNQHINLDDFGFLTDYGIKHVSIAHTRSLPPATINAAFIDMLPTLHDAPDRRSDLYLSNIRVDACNMLQLYEKAKTTNFKLFHFALPISDATDFGEQVLGIKDFSFFTSKKTKLTTSRQTEHIYYTYHVQNHRFYMFDGRHNLRIERRKNSEKIWKLEVRIEVQSPDSFRFINHGDGRIPYAP